MLEASTPDLNTAVRTVLNHTRAPNCVALLRRHRSGSCNRAPLELLQESNLRRAAVNTLIRVEIAPKRAAAECGKSRATKMLKLRPAAISRLCVFLLDSFRGKTRPSHRRVPWHCSRHGAASAGKGMVGNSPDCNLCLVGCKSH